MTSCCAGTRPGPGGLLALVVPGWLSRGRRAPTGSLAFDAGTPTGRPWFSIPQPGGRQTTRTTTLIAGTSGIVVVTAGFFDTTSDPPSGATAEVLRRWYEQNLDSIGLSVTAGAGELAAITIFVVALAQLMRTAEEPRRLLTDLATASGILVAVWLWLYAASAMIPLVMADDDGRLTAVPDTAVMNFDSIRRFNETIGDLSAVPRGLLILAVSLLALQARFLPRWIAWFGLIIATASLLCVIGPAWPIEPFGIAAMIGLFGFFIWLTLISATLLIRGARTKRDLKLTDERRPKADH